MEKSNDNGLRTYLHCEEIESRDQPSVVGAVDALVAPVAAAVPAMVAAPPVAIPQAVPTMALAVSSPSVASIPALNLGSVNNGAFSAPITMNVSMPVMPILAAPVSNGVAAMSASLGADLMTLPGSPLPSMNNAADQGSIAWAMPASANNVATSDDALASEDQASGMSNGDMDSSAMRNPQLDPFAAHTDEAELEETNATRPGDPEGETTLTPRVYPDAEARLPIETVTPSPSRTAFVEVAADVDALWSEAPAVINGAAQSVEETFGGNRMEWLGASGALLALGGYWARRKYGAQLPDDDMNNE